MKVENPHANPSVAAGPFETGYAARPSTRPVGVTGSDQVRFSGEFRLAKEAVKAAETPVAIRPEVVAEARALLERGELGNDLERLADSIVNALTYSHDDHPS